MVIGRIFCVGHFKEPAIPDWLSAPITIPSRQSSPIAIVMLFGLTAGYPDCLTAGGFFHGNRSGIRLAGLGLFVFIGTILCLTADWLVSSMFQTDPLPMHWMVLQQSNMDD